jgi:hypothetical protein
VSLQDIEAVFSNHFIFKRFFANSWYFIYLYLRFRIIIYSVDSFINKRNTY